jgi:hypothetical protein
LRFLLFSLSSAVVPWSTGKSPLRISYAWYLSEWAKLLSMQEVARQFKASWHHVLSAVAMAVAWVENAWI